MSDLIKVADEINEWAKWCHDNNVKAEVQRTMYKTADEIERLRAKYDENEIRWQNIASGQLKRIAELEAALRISLAHVRNMRWESAMVELESALKGDGDADRT